MKRETFISPFVVTGSTPLNLKSGIARIGADGTGSWIARKPTPRGDKNIIEVAQNCARRYRRISRRSMWR